MSYFKRAQIVLERLLVTRLNGHPVWAGADLCVLLGRFAVRFEFFQLFRAFTKDPKAAVFYFGKKSGLVVLACEADACKQAGQQGCGDRKFFHLPGSWWLDRNRGYPRWDDKLITIFAYTFIQMFIKGFTEKVPYKPLR